jgi:glutamate-1-semialdehyde 2,1-aminomutase
LSISAPKWGCTAAAAQAALTEVLVPDAYAHTSTLGAELADGIEEAIRAAGLPWTAIRFGPRSGQWYGPMPRTGAEAPTWPAIWRPTPSCSPL